MASEAEPSDDPSIPLRHSAGSTVVPGDRIGTIRQVRPGNGTHVRGGHLYASLWGKLCLEKDQEKDAKLPKCWIEPNGPSASQGVLRVGQIVVGRVVRITPQNAIVHVTLAQGVGVLPEAAEGAIRQDDITSVATTAAETIVRLEDSFLPGDLVASKILSMGDNRRYFLTTAETELGVIQARCRASGELMVPETPQTMICPETDTRERRKVAIAHRKEST